MRTARVDGPSADVVGRACANWSRRTAPGRYSGLCLCCSVFVSLTARSFHGPPSARPRFKSATCNVLRVAKCNFVSLAVGAISSGPAAASALSTRPSLIASFRPKLRLLSLLSNKYICSSVRSHKPCVYKPPSFFLSTNIFSSRFLYSCLTVVSKSRLVYN